METTGSKKETKKEETEDRANEKDKEMLSSNGDKTEKVEDSNQNTINSQKNPPLPEIKKPDIEYSKLQGFDVLEKLPEENITDNYNENFYSTLNNLKFLSLSIPDEDRLFYHFEENENASVSATTGQILKTFTEIFMENLNIKKLMRGCVKEVKGIFKGFESFDVNIIEDLRPEILKMEKRLQTFLVEQKTEKFKLIKEIVLLQKEKDSLKEEIEKCLRRLTNLENFVGCKKNYVTTNSNYLSKTNTSLRNNEKKKEEELNQPNKAFAMFNTDKETINLSREKLIDPA